MKHTITPEIRKEMENWIENYREELKKDPNAEWAKLQIKDIEEELKNGYYEALSQ